MSWAMTDSEIGAMWRGCKNRNEQVNILADLNVKSRKEVLDKLRELQCDMRGVRTGNKGGGATKKPPMDELRAMQLYEEGLNDLDIAEALGETQNRVKHWRRRMKLPPITKKEDAPAEAPKREEGPMGPVKKTENARETGMDALALRTILERLCEGYGAEKTAVRCGGKKIGSARISVLYGADGSVETVELELLTE